MIGATAKAVKSMNVPRGSKLVSAGSVLGAVLLSKFDLYCIFEAARIVAGLVTAMG